MPNAIKNTWPEKTLGSVPGIGLEASLEVPAGEVYDLDAVEVELAASATVANRVIEILFTDADGVELGSVIDATVVAEDETVKYHLGRYATVPTDTATDHYDKIPEDLVLPAGFKIITRTALLDTDDETGDQYSAISAIVTSYVKGGPGVPAPSNIS